MRRGALGVVSLAVGVLAVSGATALATPPGTNGLIAWHREVSNAPPHLWVANSDGSQAREVFAEDDAATFLPAFSPVNAAGLAFTRGTDKPFSEEIMLGDLLTGEVRQLTDSKRASIAPSFSPDGKRIAFFSVRRARGNRPPGPERIVVMNVDGTGRRFSHAQEATQLRSGLLARWDADRLQRESAPGSVRRGRAPDGRERGRESPTSGHGLRRSPGNQPQVASRRERLVVRVIEPP